MSQTQYINDILIILIAAVIAVPIFNKFKLGSILGYLTAGAVVGPWGMGFIHEVEEVQHIAEFGVVFLLFIIGIELKPARLWVMRREVFGLGTAQVMVTGLVLVGITLLFDVGVKTAIIIGFGLALSSTAFGLQILVERGELGSTFGRSAFSILLLQDLAVVPLLTLVSLLAQDTPIFEGLEYAILEGILVIVAVFLIGRFLLTPILHQVATAHNSEVFTAAAVLVVLGTAWLMDKVGLSMALGAFLAGLLLAESRFRHQVIADIQPFRGILLGLFFMSVGMSINFSLIKDQGLLILLVVIGLMLIKSSILWGLCRISGLSNRHSIRVSILLSQSGEFGFVLFALAMVTGVLAQDIFQILTLIIALTMAATPLASVMAKSLDRRLGLKKHPHDVRAADMVAGKHEVIIAGFGRVGRRVASILTGSNIPYLGLDSNPERVANARAEGFDVFYGDASRLDVMKAVGCDRAPMLVITLDQVQATERLVHIVRQNHPNIPIYARARDSEHCERLNKAGATSTISETLEASLQLGAAVLQASGLSEDEYVDILQEFRREYYGVLDKNEDLSKLSKTK